MVGIRHMLTGFLAGELSPMLGGRVDTEQYAFGLATCENFVPFNEGPLVKRPGFAFIRDAAPTSTWLTAFRRGIDQEYVVEWGELIARFYTNGGRIETSPGVAYQISTPYTALEAPMLSMQQSFDRLYIDHVNHAPGALRRDTATTFAYETLELLNGPFQDVNSDKAITVQASATTGAVTITASSAIFNAGEIGSLFYLECLDLSDIPVWEAQMKGIAVGNYVRNEGRVYQAATAGATGTIQPTHVEGTEWDGQGKNDNLNDKGPYGVKWTYVHDRFGIVKITGVGGGGTTATGAVQRRLPNSLVTVPSFRWAHSAFSAWAGWPRLVVTYKGRQVHFTDTEIIGCVVGDYGGGRVNFAAFTSSGKVAEDLAFRRLLALEDPPLWVARDRKLVIATATRELAIGPTNTSAALSGSNIEADDQSFYGSERVWPVQVGSDTHFVERGGRRIRSANYDFTSDRYDAEDLTAAARHVTSSGIVQLASQRNPQAFVLGVREDGQIIVHSKTKAQIKGFARTVLGGGAQAKSAVSVVGADGKTEELWLLIERKAGDGSTRREIWKQEPWRELGEDQREAFFVDGGTRISAAAGQTTFTGFTHLAGQPVAVLANGGVVRSVTVDNTGSFTLPPASVPDDTAFTVIVGLAYTATATTMRPAATINGRPIQGLKQRVRKIATRLLETLGIKVSASGGDQEELIDRRGNSQMDHAIPLASGDYGGQVEAEFDTNGQATWTSDVPLPAIVAAAMINLEVSDQDA